MGQDGDICSGQEVLRRGDSGASPGEGITEENGSTCGGHSGGSSLDSLSRQVDKDRP